MQNAYPGITKADSLSLVVVPDSIKVEKSETEGLYTVNLGNGASMIVTVAEDGKIKVENTYGIFAYPANDLKFAKEVGGINDGMSDTEIADVMANIPGLKSYLLDQYIASHKNAILISNFKVTKDIECAMDAGEGYYTLTNTTDKPISGNEYFIICEDYYMQVNSSYRNMPGRDIPAGGSISIKVGFSGHAGTDFKSIVFKTPKLEEFIEAYTPTGTEYPEYAKTVTPTDGAPISDGPYTLAGKIGNMPIHMTLDKGLKTGEYYYDKNGPANTLKLRIVSLSKATGKIRIEEYNDKGDNTGVFDGTLTPTDFKGKMTVTFNGKTYDFDLKVVAFS